MNKNYDIVLVDADETIFDFKKAEAAALEKTLEHFGVAFSQERLQLYSTINLSCWKALERGELERDALKTVRFERFFEQLGITGKNAIDCSEVHEFYIRSLAESGALIDGAETFLKRLHEVCGIYIATNGLTIAQRGRLSRSKVEPYVDDIFISEEIGFQKPDKAYFDFIFDTLGVTDRKRVIIIGDSLTSDMQGGRNAGITTCRYLGDHEHEDSDLVDFEIRSFDEFWDILYSDR